VDYEETLSTKLCIARKIFNLEKEKVLSSSSFKQFLSENEVNLLSYCRSCVSPGAVVKLLPYDHEVVGSSPGNSLL
jgi:hypothetical protein